VRYGIDSAFYEIVSPAAGSVTCDTALFGDPIVGTVKACKCGVRIDNKYWRCSATAPADADGTQWYQVGYQGKSTWADAEVIQAAQQQGTPPGGSEFVGVSTHFTDDSLAAPQGTGKAFCVYEKPAAIAPAAGELIEGGGFEEPSATSWQTAYSYSQQSAMPPGWTITAGNMDWGEYIANGHCTSTCNAHGSSQALDMCGGGQGTIEQTVPNTAAGSVYELRYAINAHASCGGSTKSMNVYVDDVLLVTETKDRCGDWSAFAGCWTDKVHDVTAASTATKLTFKSLDDSCGCMTLDEVSFKLKPAAR